MEHVVDEFNFTHLVTAMAGGIVAIQIRPAINKCFFILNPLFIANEKTTKIFQVVGGSKLLKVIVLFIQYIHKPSNRGWRYF